MQGGGYIVPPHISSSPERGSALCFQIFMFTAHKGKMWDQKGGININTVCIVLSYREVVLNLTRWTFKTLYYTVLRCLTISGFIRRKFTTLKVFKMALLMQYKRHW